jgi:hypothetical protein
MIEDVVLHGCTASSFTAAYPLNDAVMVDFRALPTWLLCVPTTPPTKMGNAEGEGYDESVVDMDHLLRATSTSP